jgi:hypothetical protein
MRLIIALLCRSTLLAAPAPMLMISQATPSCQRLQDYFNGELEAQPETQQE